MIVMLAILVMLVMMMMEDDDGDDDNEVMLGRASVLGGIRMWPSQEKRDKRGRRISANYPRASEVYGLCPALHGRARR